MVPPGEDSPKVPEGAEDPGAILDNLDDFLTQVDTELEDERRRHEAEREEKRARLEAEIQRLREQRDPARERLERARALGADAIAAKVESVLEVLDGRVRAAVAELGYDPQAKAAETAARESRATAEPLLTRVGETRNAVDLAQVTRDAWSALERLGRSDAQQVFDALRARAEERGWEPDAEAARYLADFRDLPDGEEGFREATRALAERRRRAAAAAVEVERLENRCMDLVTAWGRLPTDATQARVHALACEAKLLQKREAAFLDDDLNERLRTRVFGRLHNVVKESACGYVPSLRRDWFPESLEKEIEEAHARDANLTAPAEPVPDGAGDAWEAEEASAALEAARGRAREAERWVLAEVYRWSNARFESPGDEQARERVHQAAAHALRFLQARIEELPAVLRHDADLFEEGSDFRWLRKRFKKLAAETEAETAADEEAVAESTLETLTGERVPHPSVARARALTRGRAVVMVGGAVRAERRDRLRELFEASELDWVAAERGQGVRSVQTLCERIRSRTPDIVICLYGFMSHAASGAVTDVAREHGVPCAVLPRGYGEVAIAEAICAMPRNEPPE